jgi:hypothetical protein
MKPLPKILLLVMLSLTTITVSAQKTKPRLFGQYPEVIDLSKTTLQQTFSAIPGKSINIAFNDQFHFEGIVLSNELKYSNLQSVLIRSAAFGNAIFQVSKLTNADNSISYVGRIINPDAQDGYEIKKDNKDNYRFQKFETDRILQDCSYQ